MAKENVQDESSVVAAIVPALLNELKRAGVLSSKKLKNSPEEEEEFAVQELPHLNRRNVLFLIRVLLCFTRMTNKVEGMVEDLCRFDKEDVKLGHPIKLKLEYDVKRHQVDDNRFKTIQKDLYKEFQQKGESQRH